MKKIVGEPNALIILIEQASDALCIIDPSSKIIEVNQYASDKLGYSKEELIALSIDDLFF
jgi:PAS domain S-box-containing protein